MAQRIITISGYPASGKTKVGSLLADETGWEIITIGALQRKMAAKLGMDTIQFNVFSDSHPGIDAELDEEIRKIGESREDIIVDSRLAWHWIPGSLKVFITVDLDVGALRVLDDKSRKAEMYDSKDEAKSALTHRICLERERLISKYGVDYSDFSHYDLVIDSSALKPEEVCRMIIQKAKELKLFF